MQVTVREAFNLLLEGKEVMVRPYGDDDDFVGVSLFDILSEVENPPQACKYELSDDEIQEVYEYLNEKEELELWD